MSSNSIPLFPQQSERASEPSLVLPVINKELHPSGTWERKRFATKLVRNAMEALGKISIETSDNDK